MTKFIDTNIFLQRWTNPIIEQFLHSLNSEEYCTSVLVLAEVYHKLNKKGITHAFEYVRSIMGSIRVYDLTQEDLFNALKYQLSINVNDKLHLAVMKRNGISTIISFDKDFDKDKSILREEI